MQFLMRVHPHEMAATLVNELKNQERLQLARQASEAPPIQSSNNSKRSEFELLDFRTLCESAQHTATSQPA
jgi:hypothetical protein